MPNEAPFSPVCVDNPIAFGQSSRPSTRIMPRNLGASGDLGTKLPLSSACGSAQPCQADPPSTNSESHLKLNVLAGTSSFASKCCGAIVGHANIAGVDRTWKFTIRNFAVGVATMPKKTRSLCAPRTTRSSIAPRYSTNRDGKPQVNSQSRLTTTFLWSRSP